MAALRAGDWDTATALGQREGSVGADIIEWQRLRAGRGNFDEVRAFLERRGDWPGLALLRRRSEGVAAEGAPAETKAFFQSALPQTGEGALAYAAALRASGQESAARDALVFAWRSLAMDPGTEAKFLSQHAALLADHQIARLDMLLWTGETEAARRLLDAAGAAISPGWAALAKARIALRAREDGVDALIEAIPAALAEDPGLAYERFLWRTRAGRNDSAVDLLLSRSTSAQALGEPERWANMRRQFARQAMRAGDLSRAYRIASSHHLTGGANYADLEWLAGYLSLKLHNPARALDHFKAMSAAVATPISLGRAGYWLGRSYEQIGDMEAATRAYGEAAKHQTGFYGLLAADRAGIAVDEALRGLEPYPDWREAGFTGSSVFQAGVLSLAAGELYLAERFFVHLSESLSEPEIGALGRMAEELGAPHIAVMLGKQAVRQEMMVERPYFAMHPVATRSDGLPPELVLSIARRESEFDPGVVSPVGARGLMQLMPGTAEEMAGDLGIGYSAGALLSDWGYNARLGAAYLRELSERFDGNPVMIAAAYNAGPSRPDRWMELYGDPRGGRIEEMVDWIEMIPFRETRNYVMRVTEAMIVYRMRLNRDPGRLSDLLVGRI